MVREVRLITCEVAEPTEAEDDFHCYTLRCRPSKSLALTIVSEGSDVGRGRCVDPNHTYRNQGVVTNAWQR
jgi:hypothetical protein